MYTFGDKWYDSNKFRTCVGATVWYHNNTYLTKDGFNGIMTYMGWITNEDGFALRDTFDGEEPLKKWDVYDWWSFECADLCGVCN